MKKNTKRALFGSVIAVILCCAMLIGTTFAWFTDSASTAVNKIQAGTLDIGLEMKDADGNWVNAEGKTLGWVAADGRAQAQILWEPGCTYELPDLRLVNNGNLWLKVRVYINGVIGDAKLLEAIEFTATYECEDGNSIPLTIGTDGTITEFIDEAMFPESTTGGNYIKIKGHMKEDAGNEYQGLSIEGIGITVVATQYTYEVDSNDNQYDANAIYPAASVNELKTVLAQGGIVAINNDITADATKSTAADRITVSAPTTLNLDAKFIVPGELEPTNNWAGLYISADTVINATEEGGILCVDKANGECGTYVANIVNGANVTVNGGTYYGGGTTFQVQKGTLTINGGHFEVTAFGEPYNSNFLLNCVDSNYANGTAKIIVKGGTFVNFNPADNGAEGANTNFVADGYTVVSETKANGDVWYTVVPE